MSTALQVRFCVLSCSFCVLFLLFVFSFISCYAVFFKPDNAFELPVPTAVHHTLHVCMLLSLKSSADPVDLMARCFI